MYPSTTFNWHDTSDNPLNITNNRKEHKNMAQMGVIHEINDLGLGFDELKGNDNRVVNEAVQKEREAQNSQIINEDNKEKK